MRTWCDCISWSTLLAYVSGVIVVTDEMRHVGWFVDQASLSDHLPMPGFQAVLFTYSYWTVSTRTSTRTLTASLDTSLPWISFLSSALLFIYSNHTHDIRDQIDPIDQQGPLH
ncbi:hypothetical protein BJ166DRAFT_105907 [Pestalotiopsis sp. NC0098]|nr:hypothetical protein BJ166DRAFT_105907 [Pestalotiopsis sp. NC0098]